MPLKPGPVLINVGGTNLLADDVKVTYTTEPFDRVEFSHDKLKSAPLSTGVTPIIVQLLGNIPAEIVIDCALTGMIGGPEAYVPRPVTPDLITTDTDKVKQKITAVKYTITGGTTPETSSAGSNVDTVFALSEVHRARLASFASRLNILSGSVAYEQLLAAQADDIYNIYFTTGTEFVMPSVDLPEVIISDFSYGFEYLIPTNAAGTEFTVRKGFTMTVEQRAVGPASGNVVVLSSGASSEVPSALFVYEPLGVPTEYTVAEIPRGYTYVSGAPGGFTLTTLTNGVTVIMAGAPFGTEGVYLGNGTWSATIQKT